METQNKDDGFNFKCKDSRDFAGQLGSRERRHAMKRIVINTSCGDGSYGGFSLSHKAFMRLRELQQREALQEPDLGAYWPQAATPREPSLNRCGILIPRDDEKLVQVVAELGAEANGHCAELKIVEVPTDVQWQLERVGGVEHISEAHRTWH
jgi:hypothetical protein